LGASSFRKPRSILVEQGGGNGNEQFRWTTQEVTLVTFSRLGAWHPSRKPWCLHRGRLRFHPWFWRRTVVLHKKRKKSVSLCVFQHPKPKCKVISPKHYNGKSKAMSHDRNRMLSRWKLHSAYKFMTFGQTQN
jgi:hypothetical protein